MARESVAPSALDAKQGISYRPVTFFQYDGSNNLTLSVPPEGMGSLANAGDCSADLSATASGSAFRTNITYDKSAKPQPVTVTRRFTDPDSPASQQTPVTTYTFDVSSPASGTPGRLLKMAPPLGNAAGAVRPTGCPTATAIPDCYATTFSYFPPGDAGKRTGLLHQVTGPWVADTSSGSPAQYVTTFDYDQVGRRTAMVDPVGNAPGATGDHTYSFSYDNEDRLTSQSAPAPSGTGAKLTTSFAFDPVGNRTSVTDANGQITRYQYDPRDSLAEVDESATQRDPNNDTAKIVTQYSYDHLGNLSRVLRAATDTANVRATDYAYDGLNRVRTETQYPSWPTTTPTLVTQSTYDGNGNRTRLQDPLNQTSTFSFDVLNRLTAITYTNPAVGTSTTANVSYQYDANNNRTSMVDGTGTTTYAYL